MSELEQWVVIPGYDHHYEVSSHGNVRKLRKIAQTYRPIVGGWAKGYRLVVLRKSGKRVGRTVHSLVLEAFTGQRPEGMQVRHINGNKLDNRLCNLTWGTALDNSNDKRLHGTIVNGEDHPFSKLSNDSVVFIKSSAMQTIWLARCFGVAANTVRGIRNGSAWKKAA